MAQWLNPQSDMGYRFMVWTFRAMDLVIKPDRRLDDFCIQKGHVVVDYGCGPGRYIRRAAEQAGAGGRVYAADIHPMAIDIVRRKMATYNLTNVIPVLLGTPDAAIGEGCADVVYALDMFHQVDDPVGFLADIHRIIKTDGVLYLEDGHQPRRQSLEKVRESGGWQVAGEHRRHLELRPGKSHRA